MHRGHSQNWLREPGTGGLMVWHLSHASKSEGTRVWSSFSQNVERHSGIKLWPPPADLRDLILLEARQGQWRYLTAQEDLISKRQEVGSQGKSWDDHPGVHPPCQDKAGMKTSAAVALPRSHKVLQRRSPLSTRDRRVTMHSMNRIRHFCPRPKSDNAQYEPHKTLLPSCLSSFPPTPAPHPFWLWKVRTGISK